ncbi:MAG: WD40 repeat domain-containing protein [Anaerolineaceae bacterium]
MKRILPLGLILFLMTGCNLPGFPAKIQAQPSPADVLAVTAAPLSPSPLPSLTGAPPAPQTSQISSQNAAQIKETGAFPFETPYLLFISPDSRFTTITGQKHIVRFSFPDFQQENQLKLPESTSWLAVSSMDSLVAVTDDHIVINLISMLSGQTTRSIQPQGGFSDAFFTPDGASLGVVKVDEIGVDMYDVANGNLIKQFRGFQTAAPVYNVFPSPDGKTLAWVSRGRIQLMDFYSGQLGAEFSHEDFISGWALSPDGSFLVTSAGGELDGEFAPLLYLWDARTGQQVNALKLPEFPSASLAFSPDGQLLAATAGKTVRLYQISDRTLMATLDGPTENISYLAFSPDGRSLLASAQDNLVHLWQVVP